MELQKNDIVLQISHCRKRLGPLTESVARGFLAYWKYSGFQELCHQEKELWEEVSRLSSIREDEKEIY